MATWFSFSRKLVRLNNAAFVPPICGKVVRRAGLARWLSADGEHRSYRFLELLHYNLYLQQVTIFMGPEKRDVMCRYLMSDP